MKKNKTKIITIISIIALVVLIVGATYAYFVAQTGEGSQTDIKINANTMDTLTFETGDPITLTLDQETFAEGKGNQIGSTFAKALLTANSKTNTATEHYYMYLNIKNNTFTYTQNENTPEIILTITDANNNEITSINGLTYKTVTDGNGTTLKGFDITTQNDLIAIFENREITTTSSITEEWNVTVTYVNYNVDQSANAGKSFSAKLIIQKNEYILPDIMVNVDETQSTYGKLGNINCSGSNATYNQQYNRIEISSANNDYTKCNLDYIDSTSKVNLADYIIGLSGTTQGAGKVVSETADIPDYSSATSISENAYILKSVFSSTNSNSTSGTAVSGVYTFSDNIWTSVSSAMTSGKYYHFKFKPNENGYYQMCYDFSAGSTSNQLYAFVNNIYRNFGNSTYLSASTSTAKNGCIELGYVTTSEYIKITQYAYTDISTLSFSIKKVNNVRKNVNAGIRYEGKNPNNYIWFNNEYWRIIGVFDSTSHGQSGKNLVKIIRDDVLDELAWDKSRVNDWTAASLNLLLNGAYYNAQDGTNSGYCYSVLGLTTTCDYTKKGIQSGYREMIANVTWYLGGYSSVYMTTSDFYGFERETMVYSGRPTSTKGFIGLMYPSDYGYSVLSSTCTRTTNLGSYNSATCAGQSWLYGKGYEWILTPASSNRNNVFNLVDSGFLFAEYSAGNGRVFRPVLYLDASVYKISGDGRLNSPYIIGM